jgi:hypothetical protein
MKNLSINALFEMVRGIILNIQEDAGLQQKMSVWGFPPERIQEGSTLLQNAQQLHNNKDGQYYAWWQLSQQVQKDRETALQTFIDHVQVARLAFKKQPAILHQLKINKINRNRVWEWTVQAHRFYTLVSEHAPLMKKHGVLPEEIQQAKAGIEALLAMKDRSMRKKGEAESATQQRNATLDALRAWHVEFRAAARLAFKDTPQRLEAFGMKSPS